MSFLWFSIFNLSSLKVQSDASSPSFSGHSVTKSRERFELDLDEPLAFVHKSSIAIAKAKLNQVVVVVVYS